MILRCILISNFNSNQPINWLYTPIELVDFFQPIELVSNWLIFAIFILSVVITVAFSFNTYSYCLCVFELLLDYFIKVLLFLKKWALLKSLCRPSVCPSVCPSVSYFSAAIVPRELKIST
jgi:hypothetical protein